MSEKALTAATTPTPPAVLTKRYLAQEGLEDLTLEEDVLVPRWRLVQSSSKISKSLGVFNNNITEEEKNCLDMIILKINPSRAFFNDNRQLVCMSTNAHHSTDGRSCLGCKFAQWGEDSKPPLCKRGYTFICLDPLDESLCLIGALSKAVTPAKRYISKLFHTNKPPFAYFTRFSSKFTEYAKGDFYLLQIETLEELEPEAQEKARQAYLSLAALRIIEVEEPTYDEFGPNGHNGPPPPPEDDGPWGWGPGETGIEEWEIPF